VSPSAVATADSGAAAAGVRPWKRRLRRERARAVRSLAPARLLYEAAWAQLAGHLQWVFWGVTLFGANNNNSSDNADDEGTSSDDGTGRFGYLEYACTRAVVYWERKRALLLAEAEMARAGGWEQPSDCCGSE